MTKDLTLTIMDHIITQYQGVFDYLKMKEIWFKTHS